MLGRTAQLTSVLVTRDMAFACCSRPTYTQIFWPPTYMLKTLLLGVASKCRVMLPKCRLRHPFRGLLAGETCPHKTNLPDEEVPGKVSTLGPLPSKGSSQLPAVMPALNGSPTYS